MTNGEVKIFSNMALILPKIEKDSYLEEDYSNIFQLIDGYKKLEKYFSNKDIINELLDKKIEEDSLYDLIRLVRNRVSHIDKHDKVDKFIILLTKVKIEEIHKLVSEIKNEMDNIYVRDLNGDAYRLIMNTKLIAYVFELYKKVINDTNFKNEFDKYSREKLKPIINNFNYEKSTIEEYNEYVSQLIEMYQTKEFKDGIIEMYDEDTYNEIIRMLTDESYTKEEVSELMTKFKIFS